MDKFENIYRLIKQGINRSFFIEVFSNETTNSQIETLKKNLVTGVYKNHINLIDIITSDSKISVSNQIIDTGKKTEMSISSDKRNVVLINGNIFYKNHSNYNKLLKFIEEPPKSSIVFVFSTKKVLPKTISSRLIEVPQIKNETEEKHFEETNQQILSLFRNSEISLKELSDSLKTFNLNQIESFLKKLFGDSLFRQLNYKQLDYVLKILKDTKEFASLNISPLGNFLSTLKKIERISQKDN